METPSTWDIRFDGRRYKGSSPLEIVQKIGADSPWISVNSADEFLNYLAERMKLLGRGTIQISGDTLEKRCETFLSELVRIGRAEKLSL